jgi:hypothetical protein
VAEHLLSPFPQTPVAPWEAALRALTIPAASLPRSFVALAVASLAWYAPLPAWSSPPQPWLEAKSSWIPRSLAIEAVELGKLTMTSRWSEVVVEAGLGARVDGGDVVLVRDVQTVVVVAGEVAGSELPEEAVRDGGSTSAGPRDCDCAELMIVCTASPRNVAGEKVVKRRVALGGHGRTCNRMCEAG